MRYYIINLQQRKMRSSTYTRCWVGSWTFASKWKTEIVMRLSPSEVLHKLEQKNSRSHSLFVSVDPHKLPGGSVEVPHTVSLIQSYPVDTRENTPGKNAQPIPQLTMPTCTSLSGPSPRMISGPPILLKIRLRAVEYEDHTMMRYCCALTRISLTGIFSFARSA